MAILHVDKLRIREWRAGRRSRAALGTHMTFACRASSTRASCAADRPGHRERGLRRGWGPTAPRAALAPSPGCAGRTGRRAVVRPFDYASAATVNEVTGLLGEHGQDGNGGARPLAGGTDLLTLMKADVATPSRLIDIKRVSGLDSGIESGARELRLGALTTLAEIETSQAIKDRYPALAEAATTARPETGRTSSTPSSSTGPATPCTPRTWRPHSWRSTRRLISKGRAESGQCRSPISSRCRRTIAGPRPRCAAMSCWSPSESRRFLRGLAART
jgi:hypothetical protein